MVDQTPPPVAVPDEGFELCYECDGKRVCWSCHGAGQRRNGERCHTCAGRGLCIVCNGAGQLPLGTDAATSPKTHVKRVGFFRELGYDEMPSIDESRGQPGTANTERVVRYLKAGKVFVFSPGLMRDVFDRRSAAGTRSILTDGVYAWPDSLAYYVDRYAVALPADFEQHLASRQWEPPEEVQVERLTLDPPVLR